MSLTLTLLIGGITIALILFLRFGRNRRPKGFPPGPTPLPILGNLHQIGLEPHKNFVIIGKKYGGIFGIDFGSYRSVVVNDLKLIKQCLSDPAVSGRPKFQLFLDRAGAGSKYARGIITSESNLWAEQRRFALKNLRDFGFGKNSMEKIIQEEILDFIESLRVQVGRPIRTRGLFNAAVLNSLWRICTGVRLFPDDPQFQNLLAVILDAFAATTPLVLFFPILKKLCPELSGYNTAMAGNRALYKFIKAEYDNHKLSSMPGEPRDLMDVLIEEVEVTTDSGSSFYKNEGEANVIKSFEDLFLGGIETTATTLTWIFLAMALFPEIQEKMSKEIQQVIGHARQPELIDRSHMPYTECVIMEVLRYVALFPLAVIHNTHEEVNIGGYIIPKDTVVAPNLYAVLHDEGIWGDPEVFRPERFLLPDGTPNKNHEAFIPFSYGKRICIGEKLAKDELFLFTASLFQHFRVSPNPNGPKPTFKSKATVILSPNAHELIIHERI